MARKNKGTFGKGKSTVEEKDEFVSGVARIAMVLKPYALRIALGAMDAFRFLGHPEGDLALAQAAVYLATAPKSNRVYTAWNAARQAVRDSGALPVPLHIRNAPTSLMKDLGYGHGYQYAHDFTDAYVAQAYLPEAIGDSRFYSPTDRGYEKRIAGRLTQPRQLLGLERTLGRRRNF